MNTHFDVAIIGTGLPESIIAAALAKKGLSILHLDPNSYYGGSWAALSLAEAATWAASESRPGSAFSGVSWGFASPLGGPPTKDLPTHLKPFSRQYALAIVPTLVPSHSPAVDALVASGVSDYVTFRLLEGVGVFETEAGDGKDGRLGAGRIAKVPASKEDVFLESNLSLADKRRLMRFLQWATTFDVAPDSASTTSSFDPTAPFIALLASPPHSLPQALKPLVAALPLLPLPDSPSGPAVARLQQTLKSLGKFGASPWLVGQYGGAGEWVGGYARAAAVKGAVQIVGRDVEVKRGEGNEYGKPTWTMSVKEEREGDEPLTFTADLLISSATWAPLLPSSPVALSQQTHDHLPIARGLALLPSSFPLFLLPSSPPPDPSPLSSSDVSSAPQPTANNVLIVYPPLSLGPGQPNPVSALIVGDGSLACRDGEHIVYLSAANPSQADARTLLSPVLISLLRLSQPPPSGDSIHPPLPPPDPLFDLYYTQNALPIPNVSSAVKSGTADDPIIVPEMGPVEEWAPLTATSDWAVKVAEGIVRRLIGNEEDIWVKETKRDDD